MSFKNLDIHLSFVSLRQFILNNSLHITIFFFILLLVSSFISIFYQQSVLKLNFHEQKSNISQIKLLQHKLKSHLSSHQYTRKRLSTNFAIEFYQQRNVYNNTLTKEYSNVKYCEHVQLSSPLELLHNNLHWQVLHTVSEVPNAKSHSIYLLNAYYDNRRANKPVVIIIADSAQQLVVATMKFWCLLWFDRSPHAVLSTVTFVYPLRHKLPRTFSGIGPVFFTCEIPAAYNRKHKAPRAVSLQSSLNGSCKNFEKQLTNVLQVIKYDWESVNSNFNRTQNSGNQQYSIGVCVQALRFANYEYSIRMVEWLEMVRILGADKVYLYIYDATKPLQKVLKHYQQEGFVDFSTVSLPKSQLNVRLLYNYYHETDHIKFWLQEHLELNDCLYRNLNRHDFIAVIDVDEVILPKTTFTWHQLLDLLKKNLYSKTFEKMASFRNKHVQVSPVKKVNQFTSDKDSAQPIPPYLYMARHTFFDSPIHQNFKSFHRTKHIFAIHNHHPLGCVSSAGNQTAKCLHHMINPNHSILAHYRTQQQFKCAADKHCVTTVDKSIWKYYDLLQKSVELQLNKVFA